MCEIVRCKLQVILFCVRCYGLVSKDDGDITDCHLLSSIMDLYTSVL